MKTCTLCLLEKLVSEFTKNRGRKDGLNSSCRVCRAIQRKSYYDPVANRKACALDRQQMTFDQKESEKIRKQEKYRENPKPQKHSNLKRKYGITLEAFERLAEAQSHKCAICKQPSGKLCVDHDHISGRIRELLCPNCNKGFGFFQESCEIMRAAIAYKKKHA